MSFITVPANRNYTANLTDTELLRRLKNYHGKAEAIAISEQITMRKHSRLHAIGNEYHRQTGEAYMDAMVRLLGTEHGPFLHWRAADLFVEWMEREIEKAREREAA